MDLRIIKNAGVPLVRQICEQFRMQILSGKLKLGEKIHSLRELEKNTGIGRCTFIRAFEQLAQDGLVEKRAKSGIYVCGRLPSVFGKDQELSLQDKIFAVVCDGGFFSADINLSGRRFACLDAFEMKVSLLGGRSVAINASALNYEVDKITEAVRGYDGVFCICPGGLTTLKRDDELVRSIRQLGIPLVTTDYFGQEKTNTVNEDWEWAVREIISFMVGQGYRRLAMASYYPVVGVHWWAKHREDAFLKYALQEKLDVSPEDIFLVEEGLGLGGIASAGRRVGELIFQQGRKYDAILAVNDPLAIGIMDAAATHNLFIPEDFSLSGIDNIPQSALAGLTTVSHTSTQNGIIAAEMLAEIIACGDTAQIRCQNVKPQVIVRKSIAIKKIHS